MMREVDSRGGWIDYQAGTAALTLECGHVAVEKFDREYAAPALVDCRRCDGRDGLRKRA